MKPHRPPHRPRPHRPHRATTCTTKPATRCEPKVPATVAALACAAKPCIWVQRPPRACASICRVVLPKYAPPAPAGAQWASAALALADSWGCCVVPSQCNYLPAAARCWSNTARSAGRPRRQRQRWYASANTTGPRQRPSTAAAASTSTAKSASQNAPCVWSCSPACLQPHARPAGCVNFIPDPPCKVLPLPGGMEFYCGLT